MPGKRRSYVILREDGLLLHTKPITEDEAEWLYQDAYSAKFLDRESRARYLAEHGNVLDVGEHLELLKQMSQKLYFYITGVYKDRRELERRVSWLLDDPWVGPEAAQVIEELLDKIEDFLQRPVRPRPIGPRPVRYFEMEGRHVRLECCSNELKDVVPRPEWHAHKEFCCELYHGISVFPDSLWLWFQSAHTYAVAVRRDAPDREVVAALANDGAVQGFLRENADGFRQLLREREAELIDKGYEDVVRKAKAILTTLELLNAGRREEELPA